MYIIPAVKILKQRVTGCRPSWVTQCVPCRLTHITESVSIKREWWRKCRKTKDSVDSWLNKTKIRQTKQIITSHQVLRFFLFLWEVLAYGLVSPPQL